MKKSAGVRMELLVLSCLSVFSIHAGEANNNNKNEGGNEGSKQANQKARKGESVNIKDLPQAVVDATKKAIKNGRIADATKTLKDNHTVFDVHVRRSGRDFEVVVEEDGNVISSGEEKEEPDTKEEKKGR